jgi:hypothetical protein
LAWSSMSARSSTWCNWRRAPRDPNHPDMRTRSMRPRNCFPRRSGPDRDGLAPRRSTMSDRHGKKSAPILSILLKTMRGPCSCRPGLPSRSAARRPGGINTAFAPSSTRSGARPRW